jgi:hypothetical protein
VCFSDSNLLYMNINTVVVVEPFFSGVFKPGDGEVDFWR